MTRLTVTRRKLRHAPVPATQSLAQGERAVARLSRATFHRPASRAAPGFRSQFLRAIDAIADNIAEGAGQSIQRQFARYLGIAIASSDEADNQLERGRGIGVFDRQEARELQERLWEVRRMLIALRRAVKRRADEDEGKKGEDDDTDETEGDGGTQEAN